MRKITVSFLVNADTDEQAERIAADLIEQARYAAQPVITPAVPAVYGRLTDFSVESVKAVTVETTEDTDSVAHVAATE